MGEGSDLDIDEKVRPGMGNVVVPRRKVVSKKVRKLRNENAERYKGYEQRQKMQNDDDFGWSDDEAVRKRFGRQSAENHKESSVKKFHKGGFNFR